MEKKKNSPERTGLWGLGAVVALGIVIVLLSGSLEMPSMYEWNGLWLSTVNLCGFVFLCFFVFGVAAFCSYRMAHGSMKKIFFLWIITQSAIVLLVQGLIHVLALIPTPGMRHSDWYNGLNQPTTIWIWVGISMLFGVLGFILGLIRKTDDANKAT